MIGALFIIKRKIITILFMVTFLFGLLLPSGCAFRSNDEVYEIELWFSYQAEQKEYFENLVKEYNSTRGKEIGAQIKLVYKNETEINDYFQENIGKEGKEDIFPEMSFMSGETATKACFYNLLTYAEKYVLEKELSKYYYGFLAEGQITGENKTYIFPLTKSIEVLLINESAWREFYSCRDVSEGDWSTWDGITRLGKKYYNWTDGKALLAVENLENLILAYSAQRLPAIVQSGNNEIKINVNKDTFKKLWDFYYNGVLDGYILQTDDVEAALNNGDVIAYLGSPREQKYFKTYYGKDSNLSLMNFIPCKYPKVNDLRNVAPQTGNGVVVFDNGSEINKLCYDFLNWVCTREESIELGAINNEISSCREIYKEEITNDFFADLTTQDYLKSYMLEQSAEQISQGGSYGAVKFIGFDTFLKNIAESLENAAKNDRNKLLDMVNNGYSIEKAKEVINTNKSFMLWYNDVLEIAEKY